MEGAQNSDSPKPLDAGSIIIPALNIRAETVALHGEMARLVQEAESIHHLNPFSAFRSLRRLTRRRSELANQYDSQMAKCLDVTASAVSGPGMIMGFAQTYNTALGLAALSQLRDTWSDMRAVLDRKWAYAVAAFSIYVAAASLVATVVLGLLSLKR